MEQQFVFVAGGGVYQVKASVGYGRPRVASVKEAVSGAEVSAASFCAELDALGLWGAFVSKAKAAKSN